MKHPIIITSNGVLVNEAKQLARAMAMRIQFEKAMQMEYDKLIIKMFSGK